MQNKLWKILQYGYLIVGVVFFIEGIRKWDVNRVQSYINFSFAIFIVLIFFFKRNFRRKIEQRNKESQQK